jgi:macrolide transport system ATP-binding/permease protein
VSDTGTVQDLRERLYDLQRHPVLELRGICRRFGVDPPLDALVNVDLDVSEGEWLAIVGPSGSGKSTLLNIIGLLDVPTAGTYRFDGMDVSGLSDSQRAGLRGRGIGFVFQSFHLIAHRTVLENVMLSDVYRKYPRFERAERAAQAIAHVGLSARADYLPTRLSGGERQRAAIARAIMGSPRVLLCDEPTGNLDSTTTAAILDLFAQLNRSGLTIVTITHEADVATRANRQVRIVDGRLEDFNESP